MSINERGKGGRPKEWDPKSPKGKLLLTALQSTTSYQEATDLINEILGTDYGREGIKSAAYRYGYQLKTFTETRTRNEAIREKYGLIDDDDIPVMELEDDREWVPLWMTSDWHYGHSNFYTELFESHAQQAIDLNAYMFNGGDSLETDVPTHMPQAMWGQTHCPQSQADWLERVFSLLNHGQACPGNHEGRIINLTSMCPVRQATDAAGGLYRRYGGSVIMRFPGGIEYEIMQKHGSSGGQNSDTELIKWGNIFRDADIIALGHDHKLFSKNINEHFKTIQFSDGRRKRTKFKQLGIRTGHFLKYGGYVEGRPYPPSEAGSVMVWLNTHHREIKVECLSEGTFINMNRAA